MYGKTPWNKGGGDYTNEQRQNMSESHKGQTPWNKGKPQSKQQKEKHSQRMKNRIFIYYPDQNIYKSIPKDESSSYLNDGWIKKHPNSRL